MEQKESSQEELAKLEQLHRQLEQLKTQLEESDRRLAAEKKRAMDLAKARALDEAFTAAGAINAKRDSLHYAGRVEVDEDGSFWVQDGDSRVPLGDHVRGFLEQNPELKSRPKGSPEAGGGSLPPGAVPRSKMQDTNWYMANRERIIGGEIKFFEDRPSEKPRPDRPEIDTRRYQTDPQYRQRIIDGKKV